MIRRVLRFAVLPLTAYTACYFILTFPLALSWSSAYFCDRGDGPLMIWDVWWVRHALLELHQHPWRTHLLHHPEGIGLWLHSLTPFNGILSIPLSYFSPPVQVYNTLVTFTFAASGVTAFWLAYRVTRSYWPSLAAGYAFAFCSYRFAHAYGHLHVVSTHWIPLFLLAWLVMLQRPGAWRAVAAAGTLFLVLLCDHYLFMFSLFAAVISAGWSVWRWRGPGPWRTAAGARAGAVFLLVALLTSGPIVLATLIAGHREPLLGTHEPALYSADLLGIFVPGWAWHYHDLTRAIWQPIGNYHETSISIGLAVLAAAAAGWATRRKMQFDSAGLWLWIALIFAALALGPTLHVWAVPVTRWMPYRLLEILLPSLKLAGCPARMMIMTQLACAVLAAAGLKALSTVPRREWRVVLGGLFVIAMVVESQPHLQSTFDPTPPRWVQFLRDCDEPGAVIDLMTLGDSHGMYYQTIHRRPIALGAASRVPVSLAASGERIVQQAKSGDFAPLGRQGFRFIVASATQRLDLPIVYEDRMARVYRLPTPG